MKKINLLATAPSLTLAAWCIYFATSVVPQTTIDVQSKTVVSATTGFLNSLSPAQREKVQFPFTPQKTATPRSSGEAPRGEVLEVRRVWVSKGLAAGQAWGLEAAS
jgi:hypothetical protein